MNNHKVQKPNLKADVIAGLIIIALIYCLISYGNKTLPNDKTPILVECDLFNLDNNQLFCLRPNDYEIIEQFYEYSNSASSKVRYKNYINSAKIIDFKNNEYVIILHSTSNMVNKENVTLYGKVSNIESLDHNLVEDIVNNYSLNNIDLVFYEGRGYGKELAIICYAFASLLTLWFTILYVQEIKSWLRYRRMSK